MFTGVSPLAERAQIIVSQQIQALAGTLPRSSRTPALLVSEIVKVAIRDSTRGPCDRTTGWPRMRLERIN